MKVIHATLSEPVLIPGYVRSETVLSKAKHPKIDMTVHDVGILIQAGPNAYLVPYSNVKLLSVEVPQAGTGDGK